MKQNSLTDFINEVIVELQQEGRFATANIYKYAPAGIYPIRGRW